MQIQQFGTICEAKKKQSEPRGRERETNLRVSAQSHLESAGSRSPASPWRSRSQELHRRRSRRKGYGYRERGGGEGTRYSTRAKNLPDVTSTSTGRMMNWSSLGALVLIRMKAVWLSTSLDEKLALITPFVSKGGISWRGEVDHVHARVTVSLLIFHGTLIRVV